MVRLCRPRFFLSVRVLSRLYRRLFLERLRAAFNAGVLEFFGELAGLAKPAIFAAHLRALLLRNVEWVAYAKRPFGGSQQVLDYLGRYTHRVAIARLVGLADGEVRFRWKDYRHPQRRMIMDLPVGEVSVATADLPASAWVLCPPDRPRYRLPRSSSAAALPTAGAHRSVQLP
jgi:hypothetical protein